MSINFNYLKKKKFHIVHHRFVKTTTFWMKISLIQLIYQFAV